MILYYFITLLYYDGKPSQHHLSSYCNIAISVILFVILNPFIIINIYFRCPPNIRYAYLFGENMRIDPCRYPTLCIYNKTVLSYFSKTEGVPLIRCTISFMLSAPTC